MTQNLTIQRDEEIIRHAAAEAAHRKQSLSEFVSELVNEAVSKHGHASSSMTELLQAVDRTFDLGGKPLTRDEIYAERIR